MSKRKNRRKNIYDSPVGHLIKRRVAPPEPGITITVVLSAEEKSLLALIEKNFKNRATAIRELIKYYYKNELKINK